MSPSTARNGLFRLQDYKPALQEMYQGGRATMRLAHELAVRSAGLTASRVVVCGTGAALGAVA